MLCGRVSTVGPIKIDLLISLFLYLMKGGEILSIHRVIPYTINRYMFE